MSAALYKRIEKRLTNLLSDNKRGLEAWKKDETSICENPWFRSSRHDLDILSLLQVRQLILSPQKRGPYIAWGRQVAKA
jgi:hypothetical protein